MKKLIGKILSKLYGHCVWLSQASYRKFPSRVKKVNARVISVGNITWGGTGKTPLVARLARHLKESGKQVAILTRGYGRDEVRELQRKLPDIPIVVGRDRIRKALEAIKQHRAEVLLLDDGFQHLRLHRDVDIVNINALLPFGPGGLIPSGTLREPLENLARANVFVLTKSDLGSKNLHWIRQRLTALNAQAPVFEAVHKPIQLMDFKKNRFVQLDALKGKRVAALSAIGDPFSFEKTIENLGAQVVLAGRFDDHHEFTDRELRDFARQCKELGVTEVLTTEKDYYRMQDRLKGRRASRHNPLSYLVLQIELELHDEEDFIRRCANS